MSLVRLRQASVMAFTVVTTMKTTVAVVMLVPQTKKKKRSCIHGYLNQRIGVRDREKGRVGCDCLESFAELWLQNAS